VVTGYASRTVYAWAGGLYRRYMTVTGENADHTGDLAMYSIVLGYRPPPFQEDWPHPDWRIFVEIIGEHTGRDRIRGMDLPNTGGHQIFVGPTLLGLIPRVRGPQRDSAEGQGPLGRQLHTLVLRGGTAMKRLIVGVGLITSLAATGADAEFREVRQIIFGMD
jgi:hypothetical protein